VVGVLIRLFYGAVQCVHRRTMHLHMIRYDRRV